MNFDKLYEKFKYKKQHGIICPLFFLKTNNSSQIGEFPDLKQLADFALTCGFSIVQLLPIFDTGPVSSPYSARSCYALNPIYLSWNHFSTLFFKPPSGAFYISPANTNVGAISFVSQTYETTYT